MRYRGMKPQESDKERNDQEGFHPSGFRHFRKARNSHDRCGTIPNDSSPRTHELPSQSLRQPVHGKGIGRAEPERVSKTSKFVQEISKQPHDSTPTRQS